MSKYHYEEVRHLARKVLPEWVLISRRGTREVKFQPTRSLYNVQRFKIPNTIKTFQGFDVGRRHFGNSLVISQKLFYDRECVLVLPIVPVDRQEMGNSEGDVLYVTDKSSSLLNKMKFVTFDDHFFTSLTIIFKSSVFSKESQTAAWVKEEGNLVHVLPTERA